MATSRTGTASHKRFRKAVLHRDRTAGITHCPICHTPLDYHHGQQPNSAEPDHIVPYTLGGTDHPDNGRTICRECNQRRGNGLRQARADARQTRTVANLIAW